jgi:hypothetical protein
MNFEFKAEIEHRIEICDGTIKYLAEEIQYEYFVDKYSAQGERLLKYLDEVVSRKLAYVELLKNR